MAVTLIETLTIAYFFSLCCTRLHEPIIDVVRCHWLSCGESHALCCEGRGGGLSIPSALSHSTAVVSRPSG